MQGEWTETNRRSWDERAALHARDATGFYGIDRFRAGEDRLGPIEAAEIGDVGGRRLLHLQCHIGLDTLSLARRGAEATGLDFSPTAIETARGLADELRIQTRFVEADVYEARRVLHGLFDIVFVTWGALCWLPDARRWARVVADCLAPNGFLYLAETHPFAALLEEVDGRLEPRYAWRTPRDGPVASEALTTYTGDPTPLEHRLIYEWDHPLSEVIGGLLDAGLRLDFLHEHDRLPYRRFPSMVPTADRMFRQVGGQTPIPLAYSLRATKTAGR